MKLVFVKIKKQLWGGDRGGGCSGLGVRVDVNEELKFLRKFTKKKSVGLVGVRLGGGGGGGVRMDVNEELNFLWKFKKKIYFFLGGGRVGGQGIFEQRREVFVKIQKKKLRGGGGSGQGMVSGFGGLGVRAGWM